MTVTEIKQALGSWDIRLRPETPKAILDALTYFGHIAIIPNRVEPALYGDNLLSAARYVGVFRGRDSQNEYVLRGSGMAYWLGDEDGKGDIFETAVALVGQTFANSVTALLPPNGSVVAGTISSVAGTYTGTHRYETPRKALSYVTDLFGAEWRVNGNATLDAGLISDLYVTTPKAILTGRDAGRELRLSALNGRTSMTREADDYTTRVLLLAEGEGDTIATGSADAAVVPYFDLHGNPVRITRIVSEDSTAAGNADARAQMILNLFSSDRKSVALSTDAYDVKGDFEVGDAIDVWDPANGFFDPTREIYWEGQPINPIALRCIELTWPIPEGWTVAFRTTGGTWLDLSPYYAPESGETTVVVGAFQSSLIDVGGGSIIGRSGQPDTSVPAAPAFTGFSSGSYQSDSTNSTRAAIRIQWNEPLNLDGSTIQDGDHYEIRYRVNAVIGYSTSWDTINGVFDWDSLGSWDSLTTEPPVAADEQWQTAFVGWDTTVFTLTELTPGVNYELQIRAVDGATPAHFGPWSASSFVLTVGDLIAPSTPAPPTVAGSLISIQVEHLLGKASGGTFNLEQDLDHLEVHVGGSTGFFPDAGTKVGELIATAGMLQTQIPAVGSFGLKETASVFVKVIAVDRAGNQSAPSTAATVTAELIDNAHITSLSVSKLTAGTITAASILANDLTIGTGGNIKITSGSMQVFDEMGRLLIEIGQQGYNSAAYGMAVYEPGIPSPIIEFGKHYYGIGMLVNDQYWDRKVEIGKLLGGEYGMAVANESNQITRLEDFIFGPQVATDQAQGTRTANTFGDLTGANVGPSVTVNVGETGRVLLFWSAEISWPGILPGNNPIGGGVAPALSGANTMAATGSIAMGAMHADWESAGGAQGVRGDYNMCNFYAFTGLNPGQTVFTLKYKSYDTTGGSGIGFLERRIAAFPY